ncbi:uncharacterized protein [Dermacentor andersoni]|uniref:uncharacterized protein isoform X2 n=1 Tax=Dermacentor andersoni TaxID=34620 RepID=UPI0024171311|nr:uncharacterized protein LOC126516536 isoform X2 [Dermacentor andersoni]
MEKKSTVSQSFKVRYNSPDFMRMMLEMQMKRRRQLALKATSTASARPSSETGDSQNSTKTALETCRPPEELHQENKNVVTPDTYHNRQPFYMTTSDRPVVYPKPRLVDSQLLNTLNDGDPVEHLKSRQDHNELALKATSTASARPSSETGDSQNSTKTALEICKPPEELHQENKNVVTPDTYHNRQPFYMTTSDRPVVYPKPRLVDSQLLNTLTDGDPVEHLKAKQDHTELALTDAATACAMPSSRASRSQKSTKPTMAIYRPPEMLRKQSENAGASDTDHNEQQPFSTTTSDSQVVYPKPRLVDSRLLNTSTNCGPVAHPKPGKDHSEVPNDVPASLALCCASDEPEPIGNRPQSHSGHKQDEDRRHGDLIAQAMSDPTSLNSQQLVHLGRVVSHTAALTTEHAEPAAEFCYKVALATDSAFLEGLLSGCRELYAKREELMAPLEPSTDVAVRWMPYVSFLAQLLVAFVSSDGDGATAARDTVETRDGKRSNVISKNTVRSLAILLDCCFRAILRPPSLSSFDQMECLKSAMTVAGKAMEKAEPHLMQAVMSQLHDAYFKPGISEHSRKVLLELIELHASGWQLKSSTQ